MPHFGTEFGCWTGFWVEQKEFCSKSAFNR